MVSLNDHGRELHELDIEKNSHHRLAMAHRRINEMNEDQPTKPAVKPVSDREFMQMASRASEEIKMLRNVIAKLEPKADAYDRLSAVIDMARPRGGFASGEDLAYKLDKRAEEIAETLAKPQP